MASGTDAFHDLVAAADYPMYIVTAAAGGRRAGCLVGFATQASIVPPRMMVCLSKANFTFSVASQAALVVVHFLGAEDRALASIFGAESGDDTDKFASCEWDEGPQATPVLRRCRGWIAGAVLDRLDAGDHQAVLLAPEDGRVNSLAGPQLGFQAVARIKPGHPAT